ncbi:stonustoxin subunit beta-like [Diretmus argenteus]
MQLKPIGLYAELSFADLEKVVAAIKLTDKGNMDQLYEEFCACQEEMQKAIQDTTKSTNLCDLTLDPNTAHRELSLSEDNRKVTKLRKGQPRPDHPDRFDSGYQVLCRDGLTGRCYCEMEWKGWVEIGMTYRGISRDGERNDCSIGRNEKSWSLHCCDGDTYSVWHNNRETVLPFSSSSNRVGVYLDWSAGTLSFYRVSSDSLIHLHTFTSTFTEPLYPAFGFGLWSDSSSVSLCQ